MNIVIVTPYYAPAWGYGGPPKVLSTLAANLVKSGNSVSIITTDVLGSKRNTQLRENKDGVAIYRFRTFANILAYKYKIFYIPNLLSKSRSILDTADCVLFSDVRSLLNWQLFEFVVSKSIHYGIFAFGQIPYGGGLKSIIKKFFDILWTKKFIRLATWRFSQTSHEQRMFKKYFNIPVSQTHLLLLPIEMPKLEPKLHTREKIILFVGRFHILKGVDRLIQSCVPLLRADKTCKLVLIGRDDGAEKYLRSMVPGDLTKSIIFPGAVYGKALSTWYRRATCFAFTPRYYEETSTAALEALSYGCPVVTVPESEIPFLSEYKAGVSIQNTIQDIRLGILRVLRNSKRMKTFTRKLIYDHYEVGSVSRRLQSYMGACL